MAEWISVFCRRAVRLDAEELYRELDIADLETLAEALDLPEGEEAAVEAMRPHLRTELRRHGGRAWVEVRWKPGQGRPIRVEGAAGPDAAAQVAELLEELPPDAGAPGAARVRDHLRRTGHVVNIEMSAEDAQHLGATLGGVLAFFVAETGDGLVWFFDQDWVSPKERGRAIWNTGRR